MNGFFAVLGTVAGFITARVLEDTGRIKVFMTESVRDCEIDFSPTKEFLPAEGKTIDSEEKVETSFSITVGLFNSKNNPTAIRDIKCPLRNGKETLIELLIIEDGRKESSFINFKPREYKEITFGGKIVVDADNKERIAEIEDNSYLEITWRHPNPWFTLSSASQEEKFLTRL